MDEVIERDVTLLAKFRTKLREDLLKQNETIKLAGCIAAYYSKASNSKAVCVDYTQVKWVKKVKGTKGSFVIYTHEKNEFADPDISYINENTTKNE